MGIEKILAYITAIVNLWPSIKIILDQFLETPKEKRAEVAREINHAITGSKASGDTSHIGEIIKRGKL